VLAGVRLPLWNEGLPAGQEAVAHFGLGTADKVDVAVVLPHGKVTIVRKGVATDKGLVVKP